MVEVVGSSPIIFTKKQRTATLGGFFVFYSYVFMIGLEGGRNLPRGKLLTESEFQLFDCLKSQPNSPVDCLPGRAAKGASPIIFTKKQRTAILGGFFCFYNYAFMIGLVGGRNLP